MKRDRPPEPPRPPGYPTTPQGRALKIYRLRASDRAWARRLLKRRWGGRSIVRNGEVVRADTLPTLVAQRVRERLGLVTYRIGNGELEIVTLDTVRPGEGVGTALLGRLEEFAREAGCRRMFLTTTNDNLPAQEFLRSRGLYVSVVRLGGAAVSREVMPSLPRKGWNGLAVLDEIEFELPIPGRIRPCREP